MPQPKALATQLAGLTKIELPTPFRVGPVNSYLLEGEVLTLLDCGARTEPAWEYLQSALAERGYRVADIQRLILSHHHVDHVGLAAQIVAESHAEVWCHPYCIPHLQNQEMSDSRSTQFVEMVYFEAGIPKNMMERLMGQREYLRYRTAPVEVTRTLDEGDIIQMADKAWQVYHTPGHAGDLLCFYQPEERILLASDHLIKMVSSNPLMEPAPEAGNPRPRRLIEYITHLERIAELDIAIAYSGHGAEITNVRELVVKRVAFHQKRAEHILQLFEGQAHNLWEMTEKMFSHVGEDDKFLAISEVLGHVDLLEQAGRLSRTRENGVVYWQPA